MKPLEQIDRKLQALRLAVECKGTTHGGKKGKWRKVRGVSVFFPDDGSPPMGGKKKAEERGAKVEQIEGLDRLELLEHRLDLVIEAKKEGKLYTLGGKKGVWRTVGGAKVFLPLDGSAPKTGGGKATPGEVGLKGGADKSKMKLSPDEKEAIKKEKAKGGKAAAAVTGGPKPGVKAPGEEKKAKEEKKAAAPKKAPAKKAPSKKAEAKKKKAARDTELAELGSKFGPKSMGRVANTPEKADELRDKLEQHKADAEASGDKAGAEKAAAMIKAVYRHGRDLKRKATSAAIEKKKREAKKAAAAKAASVPPKTRAKAASDLKDAAKSFSAGVASGSLGSEGTRKTADLLKKLSAKGEKLTIDDAEKALKDLDKIHKSAFSMAQNSAQSGHQARYQVIDKALVKLKDAVKALSGNGS